jgi:hypothetical protein
VSGKRSKVWAWTEIIEVSGKRSKMQAWTSWNGDEKKWARVRDRRPRVSGKRSKVRAWTEIIERQEIEDAGVDVMEWDDPGVDEMRVAV